VLQKVTLSQVKVSESLEEGRTDMKDPRRLSVQCPEHEKMILRLNSVTK